MPSSSFKKSSISVPVSVANGGTGATTLALASIATYTGTQTLTNKTLTTPIINVGSDADGDIYYRNSGNLVRLPKGTANQEIRMNAGATAPEWYTPGGGGATNVFSVYNVSQQNYVTGAEFTINFDTELIDTGSNFSTSTFKYTTPSAGNYFFSFCISASSVGTSNVINVWLNKGSLSYFIQRDCNTGTTRDLVYSIILPLSSGETIWLSTNNAAGGYGHLSGGIGGTSFFGYKI